VESKAVVGIAVLAAAAAALSDASPTGTPVWDEILKAALAAIVVVAASKAPRWPVIFMAAVTAAASFSTFWAVAGWLALVISIVAVLLGRRSRLIGAVAAAIAVQSVLRLPAVGFFGLQSIIAFVAIVPVLVSGFRFGTKRARQIVRGSIGVMTVLLGVIGLFGGLALLNARTDVTQGINAARSGLDAGRAGDTEVVANELDRAERSFARATQALSGLRARSLRLVPVVAQHQRAIEEAVTQGGHCDRRSSCSRPRRRHTQSTLECRNSRSRSSFTDGPPSSIDISRTRRCCSADPIHDVAMAGAGVS